MRFLVLGLAVAAIACDRTTEIDLLAPTNLTYRLEPSGDPDLPAGILLQWDPVLSSGLEAYEVYSRPGSSGSFDRRATTTSTTFHDIGVPDLEYYVTARTTDGRESAASNAVYIDERTRMARPATLTSTSLDGAIYLGWSDNAFLAAPSAFKQYRIYSTFYDLDADVCEAGWILEGTTVAPEFLVGALANGISRCFAASAESHVGDESVWSPLRADTPRPEGRNILMFPLSVDANASGFRFFDDANGDGQASRIELGLVGPGGSPSADFWVYRDGSNDIFLVPQRAGVRVAVYGSVPVGGLTSIDFAPETGYATTGVEAVPGWGYVFEMPGGDGFLRFGALRVTHASADYLIFDWAYQTDPGNPELRSMGTVETGVTVRR
jgi:hypothetical protein